MLPKPYILRFILNIKVGCLKILSLGVTKLTLNEADFLVLWLLKRKLKRKCVIDHAFQIPVLRQSGDVYLGDDVDPTPASSSLRGCQLVQTIIRAYDRSQNHADQAPSGMLNSSPK